jgi:hypothetical protein
VGDCGLQRVEAKNGFIKADIALFDQFIKHKPECVSKTSATDGKNWPNELAGS